VKALVAVAFVGLGLLCSSCDSDDDQSEAEPAEPCRIAFRMRVAADADAPSDIVVVNPDGTGQRNLTAGGSLYEWSPAWLPDGRKIAFTAQGDLPAAQIYVMNADGSGPRKLTPDGANGEVNTWSPEGAIFYTRLEHDGSLSSWVINADGSEKRRFRGFAEGAVPSPDGEHIAGIRNSGLESAEYYGSPDVYVEKANGEDGRWLTRSGDTEIFGWSPNGEWILYYRQLGITRPGRPGLYVVRPDGSERRRLTQDEESYDATWSPDGRRVLYSSQSSRPGIYVVRLDGRPPRRLTRRADDLSASWSREGTRIVFYRAPGEIWMMKRDGTDARPVAQPRGGATYDSPAWSPACK
jgi:Tol biopolymer transport system component